MEYFETPGASLLAITAIRFSNFRPHASLRLDATDRAEIRLSFTAVYARSSVNEEHGPRTCHGKTLIAACSVSREWIERAVKLVAIGSLDSALRLNSLGNSGGKLGKGMERESGWAVGDRAVDGVSISTERSRHGFFRGTSPGLLALRNTGDNQDGGSRGGSRSQVEFNPVKKERRSGETDGLNEAARNLRKSSHSFLVGQRNAGKRVYIPEALSKEKKRAGRKCRLSTRFQFYFPSPSTYSLPRPPRCSSSISRLCFESNKSHLKILPRLLIEYLPPDRKTNYVEISVDGVI